MTQQQQPPRSIFGCLFVPLVIILLLAIFFYNATAKRWELFSWDYVIAEVLFQVFIATALLALKAFIISWPIDAFRRWLWRDRIAMTKLRAEKQMKIAPTQGVVPTTDAPPAS